jgi:hypothetical protein
MITGISSFFRFFNQEITLVSGLVICGKNTHSADGVKSEVQMSMQRRKPVLFLRALKEGSSFPEGVAKDSKMIPLDWKSVYETLSPLAKW